MPILTDVQFNNISKDAYHSIRYRLLDIIFSIQRDFGRFCSEKIYQNELQYRCEKSGYTSVQTEVPILITHGSFQKSYYIDVVIENSLIIELKAVDTINNIHRKQALNYLLLTGMQNGLLVNMRPTSVEHEYISTNLTSESRRKFKVIDKEWCDKLEKSIILKESIINLAEDWGLFIDYDLYLEALTFLFGGKDEVVKPIEIVSGNRVLGSQNMHMINPEMAFTVSAVKQNKQYYKNNLCKMIQHTCIKYLQWINFDNSLIEFITVSN